MQIFFYIVLNLIFFFTFRVCALSWTIEIDKIEQRQRERDEWREREKKESKCDIVFMSIE